MLGVKPASSKPRGAVATEGAGATGVESKMVKNMSSGRRARLIHFLQDRYVPEKIV